MKEITQDDLSWCRRVAAGVCREFGLAADRALDDLTGAGMVGLTMAANRYEPAKAGDLTFREYAALDVRKRCVAEAVRTIRCGVVGNDAPQVESASWKTHMPNGVVMGESIHSAKDHCYDRPGAGSEGQGPLDGCGSTRTSDLRA
jgi:hypothetical protein